MDSTSQQEYLASCCTIARDAGKLIMTYFTGGFTTSHKDDKSPVTDADIAANTFITQALAKLTPDIPVIGEEDETLNCEKNELFWLVDPLDGTRSFVRGEPEFTVNIGLINNHQPLLGVIYSPPHDLLYWGGKELGAFRSREGKKEEAITTRLPADDGLVVVRSRSHPSTKTADYLKALTIREMIPGSSSIKFCQVAEGSADLYPRFGRTMEWDTAAGHAILEGAGGRVTRVDGEPLTYGKSGFENPPFIAYGK